MILYCQFLNWYVPFSQLAYAYIKLLAENMLLRCYGTYQIVSKKYYVYVKYHDQLITHLIHMC